MADIFQFQLRGAASDEGSDAINTALIFKVQLHEIRAAMWQIPVDTMFPRDLRQVACGMLQTAIDGINNPQQKNILCTPYPVVLQRAHDLIVLAAEYEDALRSGTMPKGKTE